MSQIRTSSGGGEVWGAMFSDCETYRYHLWREWNARASTVAFCLMNPSKATEEENDPTVAKQRIRATGWEATHNLEIGRIDVVNVFAYRETDSSKLRALHESGVDLIGPENDEMIIRICTRADIVICGWGETGELNGRGAHVAKLLRAAGVIPHALRINSDGSPSHPGRLGYDLRPRPFFKGDPLHPSFS